MDLDLSKNNMELKKKNFECIKEDNSEEENNKQWEFSKSIFIAFREHLLNKGYKANLTERQVGNITYFVMNYFFVYADKISVLETDEATIRKFLGNWYIRKNWSPNFKKIKEILSALFDFFEFIQSIQLITADQFEGIKEVCKDKDWFEKRLKTYKTAKGEDFREWIEEYNYDW